MNNPFNSLQKQREAEENEKRKNAEAQQKIDDAKTSWFAYFVDLRNQHSPMVNAVLEQLKVARYPHSEIMLNDSSIEESNMKYRSERDKWRPSWELGYWSEYDDDWGGHSEQWINYISVKIDIDKTNTPFFICASRSKTKVCSLSQPALIDALLKLHK